MASTRTMTFELSEDAAQEIETRVASGVYEDAAEFLRETVETSLLTRSPEIEQWLVEQVGPTYDAYHADPSRLVPEEEAFDRVAAMVRVRITAV